MILTSMVSMNLTHHFLIAMPGLNDPNFYHTVTYICSHNEEGAMGIVINKPLDLMLGEVLDQMDITLENEIARDTPIYDGGPVQSDRGFILHQYDQDWDSSLSTVQAPRSVSFSRISGIRPPIKPTKFGQDPTIRAHRPPLRN